jgi:hypothetical protein
MMPNPSRRLRTSTVTSPASDNDAPSSPLPNLACPLCAGPNGCAVAASGRFDTPCWCASVAFDPVLLAREPEARRRAACICRRCAEDHAAAPVSRAIKPPRK